MTGGDRRATAIMAAAVAARDLEVVDFVPGTRFGHGVQGCLERVGGLVSVATTLRPGRREVVIAHEIGHFELHEEALAPVTTIDPQTGRSAVVIRIQGHSALERHELMADAFAADLLLPADWLRDEIVVRGRRPSQVAAALGLPRRFTMRQAVRAVMLPPLRPTAPRAPLRHGLDATQLAAATWAGGPLLVEAGPGTGKTATLVARVLHLLAGGVPPSGILVLTFSNRAADELRSRVAEAAPAAAPSMWIGTFHAFGLEALRRWHGRAGLGATPTVLDRDGALGILERNLVRLRLRAHRDLRDPVVTLGPVLRAIERCKDEMVTPEEYAAAVRSADPDGEGEAAEAAAEIASVYAAYQDILKGEGAVDLGDLVMMAAVLLEENDDVARHYGERFRHVLVDEFQDVNAASVRLLQSLAGPGTGLWVVGDSRQSIYRFRGAEPGSVVRFADLFGGETMALGTNYRSSEAVVAAFSTFSATMPGGAGSWTSHRGPTGSVRVMTAPTLAGEAQAIRRRIEALRATGVGYGEQAILARTHLTLERIARHLEADGVPLAYLGDLFARAEVRDLLALLSIDAEPGGIGLVRVAALPPYDVPRAEAIAAVLWAARTGTTIAAVLANPGVVAGLGAAGLAGLALLGRHLGACGPDATAADVMTNWSFERDGIEPLAAATDARSRMRLAAVHQLLALAAHEGGGRRRLLDRVRRIAALGEGRDHGVLSPEADDADAVRLMTVHGAKGLEFDAVHLPAVARHYVPLARRRPDYPPPPDLARLAMSPDDHDAEEKALFFVALSRAKDHLTISHARRYTPGREAGPSVYVAQIGPAETTAHADAPDPAPGAGLAPQPPRAAYPERDLQVYMTCPARYRFEVIDGLRAVTTPSAYRRYRRAVMFAVRDLERSAMVVGEAPSDTFAEAALDAAWAAEGPVGSQLETYYRELAAETILQMAGVLRVEEGARYPREEWVVDVGAGRVAFWPDRVVEQPWDVVVQTMGSIGNGRSEGIRGVHALMLEGAHRRFPGERVFVQTLDPGTGETTDVDTTMADDALEPYRAAIRGIERGELAPRPNPRSCPSCPYYFSCGA